MDGPTLVLIFNFLGNVSHLIRFVPPVYFLHPKEKLLDLSCKV